MPDRAEPDHPDYILYPRGKENDRLRAEMGTVLSADDDAPKAAPASRLPVPATILPFPLAEADVMAWQDRLNRLPLISQLGARFDLGDRYAAQVHIDEFKPYHLGGMGAAALNGSFTAAILDCAVGAAGVVHFSGSRAGTVSLTLNFLKPVFGARATARCVASRRTDKLLFTEACVLDQRGRVCVTAVAIVSKATSKSDP